MIESARRSFPQQEWILADMAQWTPESPIDVVFSNAALQWLGDHHTLIRHLLAIVAPGGALAFQVPSDRFAKVRALIHDVSHDPAWNERMHEARGALTFHRPELKIEKWVTL